VHAGRSHPAVCLIALAAYLLNLVAAAGGLVLCQDPHGNASFKLRCDHDGCAVVEHEHGDHGSEECWCASCPCEDRSVSLAVAPLLRDDDVRSACPQLHGLALRYEAPVRRRDAGAAGTNRPLPGSDGSLHRLRTIVLIV
jgi:hypothetical protein